jgi:ATP-binding cassette subfamily B (MDR/TAP) protein 9|uniref:ABC-type antigen peptide transporter n=1 Tax=Panagrolaimus sp. PS1159 TaxID=55785 RepID=A0AC35EXM9_9BILA
MAGSWYSPHQALGIALAFVILDIFVVMMGLMWDGRFFTVDNIVHWFDFRNYDFRRNPVDFLGVAIIRVSVLLGGAVGVYSNPQHGPAVMDKYSNLAFAIILIIIAFSPTKLLAFYEFEDNKLVIGDWILMLWCVFASLAVQGIWVSVFARVRESPPQSGFTRLYDHEDEEYYAELQRKEEEKDAQKRETFKMLFRLFGYMAKEWAFYAVAFSFLLLYSLSRVFTPYYTGEVVASVFGKDASYENLHRTVGIMALLSLSGAIFGGFRGGFFTYSQSRVDRRIRSDLFRSLVRQEIAFFDENKTGEIVSRLNADCQTMSNTLSLYMNVLTRNVTMLFGSLIFMFSLSWRLSMVTFIAIPIIFLVSKVYGVYYDRLAEEAQASIAKANDVAEEVLSAVRTVKSFACERYESLRFLTFLNVTLSIGARKAVAHVGFLLTTELLQMGILTVVLFYGGHLVIMGKIEAGLLVSFLLYQFQLGENLRELGEVWNGLMQAVGASRKVFELIDREPRISNNGNVDGRHGKLQGRIEFRNVKFNYPTRPDIPIMQDLSFTVNPGEVVALVGPSGGGKSSCIAMLEHFYEPNYGDILLDGISVRDYNHKYLHTKIALVGQEPVLYARSVRENIAYGLDYVSEDAIMRSAQLANAHNFIMETTDKYETDVGEKGSQMSGGQKQRIAIARALVRDPVVLLLDEATSALDSESEHSVQEAIQKNLNGRTVILIAHRLSTVENADKIVVISGGRVVQQGVHQELISQEGIYKQLVQRQMLGGDLTEEDVKKPDPPKTSRRRIRAMSPTSGSVSQSFLGTSVTGSYL